MARISQEIHRPFSRQSLFANEKSLMVRGGRKNREHDARRKLLRTVDALSGLLKVGLLRFKNIGDKFLRIAVNDGEPGALHLNHEAMALLENVIRRVQIDGE